jgi:hypothetical protein
MSSHLIAILYFGTSKLRNAGWVQWLADRALDLLGTTVEGLPDLVAKIVAKVAGSVVLSLFDYGSGVLHQIAANGYGELADYYSQVGDLDVAAWCHKHSRAGCRGNPRRFVRVNT